jgi:hypothetical protein
VDDFGRHGKSYELVSPKEGFFFTGSVCVVRPRAFYPKMALAGR